MTLRERIYKLGHTKHLDLAPETCPQCKDFYDQIIKEILKTRPEQRTRIVVGDTRPESPDNYIDYGFDEALDLWTENIKK